MLNLRNCKWHPSKWLEWKLSWFLFQNGNVDERVDVRRIWIYEAHGGRIATAIGWDWGDKRWVSFSSWSVLLLEIHHLSSFQMGHRLIQQQLRSHHRGVRTPSIDPHRLRQAIARRLHRKAATLCLQNWNLKVSFRCPSAFSIHCVNALSLSPSLVIVAFRVK